ncbi:MAG TPA: type II secretion system F family protein [Pseudobacteroides sp.]|uniref:type II secretion system F family protein n=1 Tax=Pseudobacteroides sp. TaxID=1968840 RepID=UPI002F95D649
MILVVIISTFITVFLLGYVVLKFIYSKQKAVSRIKRYINTDEIREDKRKVSSREYRAGLGIIARGIGNARFLDNYKREIQRKLVRAHLLLKAEEFITISLILMAILGFLTFITSNSVLMTIILSILGWLLPPVFLKMRIKKRLKMLNEQLSDAIVLMSNSLKAGYSFFQAVDIISKEMTGPIAEEFAFMQKEVNLGLTTEKALENLVNRIKSDDLELVVTAVLIQRQVGGNLSEVLDNISTTIRERIKIKGEVKTVTAQGRASGFIISVLPFGLGLILFVINRDYMIGLFTHPIGILIVVFSLLMELTGIYFISRIVKIEI